MLLTIPDDIIGSLDMNEAELLILESDFSHDLSVLKSAPWLQVCPASDVAEVLRLQRFLDAGESQAIVLAKELHADYSPLPYTRYTVQRGFKTGGRILKNFHYAGGTRLEPRANDQVLFIPGRCSKNSPNPAPQHVFSHAATQVGEVRCSR